MQLDLGIEILSTRPIYNLKCQLRDNAYLYIEYTDNGKVWEVDPWLKISGNALTFAFRWLPEIDPATVSTWTYTDRWSLCT